MPLHPLLLIPELVGPPGGRKDAALSLWENPRQNLRREDTPGGDTLGCVSSVAVTPRCSSPRTPSPSSPVPMERWGEFGMQDGCRASALTPLQGRGHPWGPRLCFVHRELSSCSPLLSISHPFSPSPGSDTANSHSQSWQWEILLHKGLWTKPGWRQRGIQLRKNFPPPLPGRTVGFAPCQTPNPKRCLPAGRILLKPLIYLITLITQQQRAEITANPSEFGGFISSAQVVFIYSHQSYCLSR